MMTGRHEVAKINETVYTKINFQSRSLQERLVDSYFAVSPEQSRSFPFISEMQENHRKCPYWTLLRRICPSILDLRKGEPNQGRNKPKRKISSRELLVNTIFTKDVFLYLRRVFLIIVPMHVFGNKRNLNSFLRNMQQLLSVQLWGRISLQHMVDGIKTRSMIWLQSYHQTQQRDMLLQVIHFLVMRFICPLIQSFFFVTESTTCKYKLFFYRKKTWHRLTQLASTKFVNSCRLKKVSKTWVETKLKEGKCLGVSSVRLLAKTASLRPIVNFSACQKNSVSINKHLRTLLRVLTFEKANNPAAFGATIMGVDEIHEIWKDFVTQCKQRNIQKLYFVKLDIEKCFDTINPCLLHRIVTSILSRRSHYKVYKYRKFLYRNGDNRSLYFESLEHPNVVCDCGRIKTELLGSYQVAKEVLMDKLCALLFCNVSKLGQQHYVQTIGIPQGSTLSSILCGIYYGHLEQTMLSKIKGKQDLLIRMVDDMLFITPRRKNAEGFLNLMLEGVPEFNCRCNLRKCCINFSYRHPVFGDVPRLPDGGLMNYCGLAFDTKTLNVFLDFSNYKNLQTRDTISWDLTTHAGVSLRWKMLKSVRPKCYSILFDKDINSVECINYNILCIFAVCAMKFHCLVMHLPPKQRVLNNPIFFTNIILALPQALISCVTSKARKIINQEKKFSLSVSDTVIKNLCYQTFLFKLGQHHQMYAPIIEQLKKQSKSSHTILERLLEVFRYIHLK